MKTKGEFTERFKTVLEDLEKERSRAKKGFRLFNLMYWLAPISVGLGMYWGANFMTLPMLFFIIFPTYVTRTKRNSYARYARTKILEVIYNEVDTDYQLIESTEPGNMKLSQFNWKIRPRAPKAVAYKGTTKVTIVSGYVEELSGQEHTTKGSGLHAIIQSETEFRGDTTVTQEGMDSKKLTEATLAEFEDNFKVDTLAPDEYTNLVTDEVKLEIMKLLVAAPKHLVSIHIYKPAIWLQIFKMMSVSELKIKMSHLPDIEEIGAYYLRVARAIGIANLIARNIERA